jgi:hypothetical protein
VHVLQSSLPGHPRPRREHQPARARGHGRGSARRSRARAAQRVSRPNCHAIAASPRGMMAHLPPELPGAAGQRMLIHRSARPGPQPSLELGRRDRHLMRLSGRAQRAPGPTREPAPTPRHDRSVPRGLADKRNLVITARAIPRASLFVIVIPYGRSHAEGSF